MQRLTELIRKDMVPALSVTEPGAIAFARRKPGAWQAVRLRA